MHVAPASSCACVGGQGYSAALVAALPPKLSVPAAGGPVVPVFTVKVGNDSTPPAVEDASADSGLVQLTGMALPRASTVGCPEALEHCRMPPVLLAAKPVPLTATTWPFVRPVLGVTLRT